MIALMTELRRQGAVVGTGAALSTTSLSAVFLSLSLGCTRRS